MRVKMLKDAPGSPDGIQVNEYLQGNVYDVTDALGAVFVVEGLAVTDKPSKASKPVAEPEGADESKMVNAPLENK